MTCKDCMHYEVCIRRQNSISLDPMKCGYKCPEFKNKADFAEVRRGEWIKNKPNPEAMKAFHEMGIGKAMSEKSIYFTCSCCGSWGTPTNKFCGTCGAKMEG